MKRLLPLLAGVALMALTNDASAQDSTVHAVPAPAQPTEYEIVVAYKGPASLGKLMNYEPAFNRYPSQEDCLADKTGAEEKLAGFKQAGVMALPSLPAAYGSIEMPRFELTCRPKS